MKKLIASLFAAVLMTSGLALVAETAPTASAATATPYPNSIGTATKVKGPKKVRKGKKVKVRPVVSNHATGTVTVTIRRGTKLVKRVTVKPGQVVRFKARKKGKYKIKAVYHPAKNSPFKASTSSVKVVRVK
jgi:hypothetical protein